MQILQCLTVQSAPGSGGGDSGSISRGIVKDRFKTFNAQFEEIHQRQSQWTVPDSELRESLRLAVAEVLLPAYRSFIKRFGQVPSFVFPHLIYENISWFSPFLCLCKCDCFMCAGLWLRMGKIPQSTSDTDPRILNACWMNSLKVKPGMIQSDKRAFLLIGNLDTWLTSLIILYAMMSLIYTHIDFLARVCTILSSIYVISKCLRKAIPQFLVHSNLNINLLTQGQFSQFFFFKK